jgi:hypothetical protein
MAVSWSAVHGQRKYLWGNVPALDVVNVVQIEGTNLPSTLHLLFAGMSPERETPRLLLQLTL